MFLAGKGGHNDESHNHNDIGQFIVYYKNHPIIIDPGTETYSAKTFGKDRYTIWTMQSCFHNLPVPNHEIQSAGREYCARNVKYSEQNKQISYRLTVDAYSKPFAVRIHNRTIQFDKETGNIKISDELNFNQDGCNVKFNFILHQKPEISKNCVFLKSINGEGLWLKFRDDNLKAYCEDITLTDAKIIDDWQTPNLYRLILEKSNCPANSIFDFVVPRFHSDRYFKQSYLEWDIHEHK